MVIMPAASGWSASALRQALEDMTTICGPCQVRGGPRSSVASAAQSRNSVQASIGRLREHDIHIIHIHIFFAVGEQYDTRETSPGTCPLARLSTKGSKSSPLSSPAASSPSADGAV